MCQLGLINLKYEAEMEETLQQIIDTMMVEKAVIHMVHELHLLEIYYI